MDVSSHILDISLFYSCILTHTFVAISTYNEHFMIYDIFTTSNFTHYSNKFRYFWTLHHFILASHTFPSSSYSQPLPSRIFVTNAS